LYVIDASTILTRAPRFNLLAMVDATLTIFAEWPRCRYLAAKVFEPLDAELIIDSG
jgi:hypothetical protein